MINLLDDFGLNCCEYIGLYGDLLVLKYGELWIMGSVVYVNCVWKMNGRILEVRFLYDWWRE